MTATQERLISALSAGPRTVKELAVILTLSESRIRELLKALPAEVQTDGAKPAAFWLELPAEEVDEPTPEEAEEARLENLADGEEPAEEPAPVAKPKRIILNPQPQIDKKVAAVEEAGGFVTYASRTWTVGRGDKSVTLTSREFAALSAEELVALLA